MVLLAGLTWAGLMLLALLVEPRIASVVETQPIGRGLGEVSDASMT